MATTAPAKRRPAVCSRVWLISWQPQGQRVDFRTFVILKAREINLLGHAPSGRSIKRLARLAGGKLRRGRPPTTPRVPKRDLCDLIKETGEGLDAFSGNMLHFLNQVELEFGLSPRQYLKWVAQLVRRGRGLTFYHLSNGA